MSSNSKTDDSCEVPQTRRIQQVQATMCDSRFRSARGGGGNQIFTLKSEVRESLESHCLLQPPEHEHFMTQQSFESNSSAHACSYAGVHLLFTSTRGPGLCAVTRTSCTWCRKKYIHIHLHILYILRARKKNPVAASGSDHAPAHMSMTALPCHMPAAGYGAAIRNQEDAHWHVPYCSSFTGSAKAFSGENLQRLHWPLTSWCLVGSQFTCFNHSKEYGNHYGHYGNLGPEGPKGILYCKSLLLAVQLSFHGNATGARESSNCMQHLHSNLHTSTPRLQLPSPFGARESSNCSTFPSSTPK